MEEGGAMEAFQEAKETGLIKYIGLTGHADIRVHMEALSCFDFDVLLLPVTLGAAAHPHPSNDFRPLLKIAADSDIGITCIKAIAKGRWSGKKRYNTWYEPLDEQEAIDKAVWFALSQEGTTTYSMAGDVRLWPKIIDAAERFKQLDEEEMQEAVDFAKEKGFRPLFPLD
jgi:predicted aldo/keto reductase-like oxidoreductase